MKKIFVLVLSLILVVSNTAFASETGDNTVDENLIIELYERVENPEAWLDFIEKHSEDDLGQWLPLLLKKMLHDEHKKEVVDMTYTSVTTTYDWGPSVNKLVLDLKQEVKADILTKDMFHVESVRTFKDFSFQTFSFAENASEHVADRNVTEIYLSDAEGNKVENGQYITLEMEVGPNLSEGAALNYNILTNRNSFVDTYYKISLNPGAVLESVDDQALTFLPAAEDEMDKNINGLADKFVHNQEFSSNEIDLLYASYEPEADEALPLIIWLHGAGEGGKNTYINVMGNEASNFVSDEYQAFFGEKGAFVLAPQAPTMWMDFDGTGIYNSDVEGSMGHSYYTETLMALINEYVENHNVDMNRIYIGGCSNGGYMTVNMILEYPEYFAAAFPICQAYSVDWLSEEKINSIKSLPIWMTHSLDDSVLPIAEGEKDGIFVYNVEKDEDGKPILIDDYSNALYNRLLEAGSENIYYTVYDHVVDTSGQYVDDMGNPHQYMGHWSWIYTLNNEVSEMIDGQEITIFEWLGMQSK